MPVARNRIRHSADTGRLAHGAGHLAVGTDRTRRNPEQGLPDAGLEVRPLHEQGERLGATAVQGEDLLRYPAGGVLICDELGAQTPRSVSVNRAGPNGLVRWVGSAGAGNAVS